MKPRRTNLLPALGLCICLLTGVLPLSGTALAAEQPEEQIGRQTAQEANPVQIVQMIAPLPDNTANQTIASGGAPVLPTEIICIVDGVENTYIPVTWECEEFDAEKEGEYTFAAKLPEGYALADNTTLPAITVAVESDAAPFMLRGAVDPALYQINDALDYIGLNNWLENTAVNSATVQINTDLGDMGMIIVVPNKNITIESLLTSPISNLRLASGEAVTVTIRNLNVSFDPTVLTDGAITLASGSTLKFEGTNKLASTPDKGGAPVIRVQEGNNLTLTGIDPASVLAIETSKLGAGIGGKAISGSTGESCGSVRITGGKVKVTSMVSGTGIGGGFGDTNGGDGGEVTISGANTDVTIVAKEYGTGIGGGSGSTGGDGGKVNITGGNVTVTSANGTGIGGAFGNLKGGDGGKITISGGKLTSNTELSAGIGGGTGRRKGGDGGTVSISGKDTVVDITVSNDRGQGRAAGIGGGGSNQTGGDGADVTIAGGKVSIKSIYGAGIGGGFGNQSGGNGGTLEISGADTDVTAETRHSGAGIGGGGSLTASGTGGNGAKVTIKDGKVKVNSGRGKDIGGGIGKTLGAGGSFSIDSTGTNRAVLDMQNKGTNATLNHSIGTCQITDATGTLTGYYSMLAVTNGTESVTHAQKDFWKQGIVKSGVTVDIAAGTPPAGQYFTGWTANPALAFANANAASTMFIMPETAQAVTANYAQGEAPGITGKAEKNVAYGYAATSSEAFAITGSPTPTVTLDNDYGGKFTWSDAEKKLEIAAGLGAGAYPVKLTVKNGFKPEAVLTFTLNVKSGDNPGPGEGKPDPGTDEPSIIPQTGDRSTPLAWALLMLAALAGCTALVTGRKGGYQKRHE